MAFEQLTGATPADTFDYDFILDGLKVDVKCQALLPPSLNHVPLDYDARLQNYYNQRCDLYVFERLNIETMKGYIVGWMKKDEFYKKATLNRAGTNVGYSTLKEDTWILKYKELYPFSQLPKSL